MKDEPVLHFWSVFTSEIGESLFHQHSSTYSCEGGALLRTHMYCTYSILNR